MKKLVILQIIGIILFIILAFFLQLTGHFSFVSVCALYIFMGIGNIINARIMLMKPIEDISIHDKLTGCYNRFKLDSTIPEYENYKSYAVIFFDINNMKKVNDTYGHDAGDQILITASNQLRFWHKYGDLYRLGGDEFIVVIPNVRSVVIEEILVKWYQKLPALNEDFSDDFVCNLSYGVFYKSKGLSFEEVLNNADELMYEMKKRIKEETDK